MIRLAFVLYLLIGASIAGTLIIAALTMGNYSTVWLIGAAAAGFVIGIPVSIYLAKVISNQT